MASEISDRDTLPDNVRPIHYRISLFDLEFGGDFNYQGNVTIRLAVLKKSKEISINANHILIHRAEVSIGSDKSLKVNDVSYDKPRQRVTLSFLEDLPITEKAELVIHFQGNMNTDLVGFYRARYKPTVPQVASTTRDSDWHYQFATQFQSCDARRAFPCFDEPNLKATFDFKIEIPNGQIALSNMPQKGIEASTKEDLQVVTFETSPVMSTYLLAWAVGDFEYIEAFTERKYDGKALPVRIYTTRGLANQGKFALEHATRYIDYFSDLFEIDYPLAKSDILAVHEFSAGAMENWGLVTYRLTTILFDEANSDSAFKKYIAYVVAHELAHQWFGNLVTMDWWNELWLNEGFATWVGWLATDKLHPDWNIWPQFVSKSMQEAFLLDSLRSSHPIEVPVKDALEVDQIFDSISYLKGSSMIRMLAASLGQDVFLKGVSDYLKAFAYGNARTNDLWSALTKTSGKDVAALMGNWIGCIGFPVLTVAEEPGQISVRQSRYLSTGDTGAGDDKTTWWIPLGFKGKQGEKTPTALFLHSKEDTLRDVDEEFYKLNSDNAGFYRTNYPPARLAKLGSQPEQLSLCDRIGLIGDSGALALSGEASTTSLLALIEGFHSETDQLVWSQILASLGLVGSVFSDDEVISAGLKKFTLKLIDGTLQKIGWERSADEDFLKTQLRSLLILAAGASGNEKVIAEAKRRFELYISGKDKSAIDPSLSFAIFSIVVQHGGSAEYEALKREWHASQTADFKVVVIRALGSLQTPELLADYLSFMSSDISYQDVHYVAVALSANSKTRLGLWKYIKDNFEKIYNTYSGGMVVLDRFLQYSLAEFSDTAVERDIATFFEGRDNKGYDRTLEVSKDTITARAAYKERDRDVLREWLNVHGYA